MKTQKWFPYTYHTHNNMEVQQEIGQLIAGL